LFTFSINRSSKINIFINWDFFKGNQDTIKQKMEKKRIETKMIFQRNFLPVIPSKLSGNDKFYNKKDKKILKIFIKYIMIIF
jgi:hypothetical protein